MVLWQVQYYLLIFYLVLYVRMSPGELRMVNLLLEAKASTKMVTNDTQSSCLHIAAKSNAVSAS